MATEKLTKLNKEIPRLQDLPEGLRVTEAAAVLRLSPVSVYQAIERGEIYAVKLGRRRTVPRSVIAQMLKVDLAEDPRDPAG